MSNEIENNANNIINEKIFLLTNIFEYMPKMQNKLLPLISSSNGIKVLYSFLNYNNNCTDNIVSINEKLELLNILSKLLELNNNLIFLFLKKCKSNIKSFFDPLIDIYLNENNTAIQNKKIIEDLLLLIIKYVSTDKYIFDFIYQKLSKYFRKDEKIKLTNETFLKYLNLLDIFYTGTLGDDNNKNIIEEKKEIKNFIYFNGFKNRLSLELNKSSNNLNTDFPTLENGFSFITWIKVEKNLIDSYFLIHTNDENYFINLININLNKHNIKLQLVDSNNMILILDDIIKSNYINISSNFNYNNWNSIAFIFYSKKSSLSSLLKNSMFKLYINQHIFNIYIDLRNFISHLDKKINSIYFFENLIGKSTSILYFSFSFEEEKLFSLLNTIKEPGFYKVKYLYKFLLSNEKDYSKYSKSNIYNDNIQTKINKIIDINLKEQNIKNLMCFLCPFSYNNKANTIDDIFGNFIGVLTPENGVNSYINNFKNIENVGGIDNLLPLGELMLLSQNKKEKNLYSDKDYINYDLLEENFLNENTFLKYITIIEKIIIGYKMNLLHANKLKFFSSLELFLERLPSCIFTEQILNLFLKIGKEAFGLGDDVEENFVDMILLNEKIFSKFSEEVQQKLWDGVHDFFTSDYLQMKELIPISKICLLLRFYDSKRYDKFCCQKHAELFKLNNNENEIRQELNIMKPDMNTKINKLFETIQLYLDKFPDEEDNINLFKLLSLDLSPCLQIKIIRAYINFFTKKKKEELYKSKALQNLLKNNLFDIYEYILSISLLDVKIELIVFLKLLMKEYNFDIDNYCTKKHFKISKFFEFVGCHLLPIDLKIELDNSKLSQENTPKINININQKYLYNFSNIKSEYLLANYFNKQIYERDIESMWKVLNGWLNENNTTNDFNILNKISPLQISSYVLSLCIQFVIKLKPFYIDSLLIIVYSFIKNSALINKEDIYSNEILFPWIIETIFFFYDNKNFDSMDDVDIIHLIQQHSIELFKEFILYKRTNKENEILMNYIFDFAYYLKTKKKDKNTLNKIGAIVRLFLNTILECSGWNVNLITKFCIKFMFLFKNSEKLFNNKELNDSYLSQDEKNLYKSLVEKKKKKTSINSTNNNEIEISNDNQNSSNMAYDYIYRNDSIDMQINNNEINIIEDGKNEDYINNETTNNLIPKYIYRSLFLNKNKVNEDKATLIQIWKDFDLFNYIINYYESNLWGTSYLCKKIKLNYKGKIFKISKDLIKEYSLNGKYKNILLKDLYNCLNFAQEQRNIQKIKERLKLKNNIDISEETPTPKSKNNLNINNESVNEEIEDEKINKKRSKTREKEKINKKDKNKNKNKEKNRDKSCDITNKRYLIKNEKEKKEDKSQKFSDINILKINLLLLSIGIDITKNEKEREFLINKYEQFLLFCIVCSLNINQYENFHEFIQSNLFDLMGYGLIFLKQINEEKFKEFINLIIIPIFEDIFIEKSKILKNIFAYSIKEVYEHSALYELFILNDEIKNKSFVTPSNIGDILISRTKIVRVSSVMEKSLNNLLSPILNERKNLEEMNEKNKIMYEVIYEKNMDGKNEQFVMFVGDSTRLRRHVVNSIMIYYLEEKRKKNNIKKNKTNNNNSENNLKNSFDYIDIKYLYDVNNKNKHSLEKKINYEKKRLSNVINSLIPFFENQIKKYSTSSVLQEKKRKHIYKLNKKKLFSWRGFWSNRYIFYKHPELLKCKIKNHLTKEMTKIILTPILDVEYYMPEFSKFDSGKLFKEGDYKYKINLNIEEILREKNIKNEKEKLNNKEINSKTNNNLGFNYLKCIYKLSYEDIWEKYKTYNEHKFNFENDTIANITRNMSMSNDYEFFQSQFPSNTLYDNNDEYIINCCLVKLTHHIRGLLRLEKEKIKFIFNLDESKENLEIDINDNTFDKELGTCFGSTFKHKKSDKDKISLDIDYNMIKYIFIRCYYYQETGLEIYTKNNKNYYRIYYIIKLF